MLPSSLDLEAVHADRERRRDAVRDRHRDADEDPRPAERPADLQRKREPHEPERRDEREVRRLVLLEHRLRARRELAVLLVKGLKVRLFAREPRFHPRRELRLVVGPFRQVTDVDSLDVEVNHARQAAREQRLLGRTLVRSIVDVEHRHVVHGAQVGAQQRKHERPAGRARVERVLARLQPVLLGERSALGDVLDAQVRALREDQVRRLRLARGQERQQLLQVHLVVRPLALQEDEHEVLHRPAEDWDLAQRRLEHDADLVERARAQQHAPEQHPVDARAVVREPERALAGRHRGLLRFRGGVPPHAHLDAEELLEQERHVAHPHPLSVDDMITSI